MKYRILPFILVILFVGCTGKKTSTDQTATVSDSIPKISKTSPMLDSVRTPELKKLLTGDSIELLIVKHVPSGDYQAEQILYLDHRVSTNFKHLSSSKPKAASIHNSTTPHINNPYPDLKGQYLSVDRYNGKLVFIDYSDGGGILNVLTDSCLWTWGEVEWSGEHYANANRSADGITTYDFTNDGESAVQIKKLGGEFDLQLWKRIESGSVSYSLMVPIEKSLYIQNLVARNNLGAGSDLLVDFDKINYDSLMNNK